MAGGKREGAGRKLGSIARIRVRDYFTVKELEEFWADLKKRAKTDNKIALYFAEQMTGKAPQSVEVGGQDGQPITVKIVQYGK